MTSTRLLGNIKINYARLLLGMLITLVVSLGVHVVMLQILHVPFPEYAGVSAWASSLNTALAALAVLYLIALARPTLGTLTKVTQCLIVFALYAGLREMMRGIIMDGVVTTAWTFNLVAGMPGLAYALVLTSLAVLLSPLLRWPVLKVLGAVGIAAVMIFAVRPGLKFAFAPAMRTVAHFNHDEVYREPYGWKVLIPAYITYLEPIVACLLLAALTWPNLSPKPATRIFLLSLLILLARSMLLPTLVYSFYSKAPPLEAMLSQSQFLLETLALAVLTGLVWQFSTSHGYSPLSASTN